MLPRVTDEEWIENGRRGRRGPLGCPRSLGRPPGCHPNSDGRRYWAIIGNRHRRAWRAFPPRQTERERDDAHVPSTFSECRGPSSRQRVLTNGNDHAQTTHAQTTTPQSIHRAAARHRALAGNGTTVVTRNGQAEVYGEGAGYVVDAGKAYRFSGTGLRDYESIDVSAPDEFDRWAYERDQRWDTSPSARYVSPEVIGYQD